MRSAALKKQDYIQDNFQFPEESWEIRRARIAQAAEEACNLPGNAGSADFEEFTRKYRIKTSAFA